MIVILARLDAMSLSMATALKGTCCQLHGGAMLLCQERYDTRSWRLDIQKGRKRQTIISEGREEGMGPMDHGGYGGLDL